MSAYPKLKKLVNPNQNIGKLRQIQKRLATMCFKK